jgi:hypothetical protein
MRTRPELIVKKRLFGLLVGLAGGLAFAVTAWGIDAYTLSAVHAGYPWVKLVPGLVIALVICGLAGWVTMRFENALVGVIAWIIAVFFLARVVTWLSLRLTATIIIWLEPAMQKWLNYPDYGNEGAFTGIVFAVFFMAALIMGALENVLVEQATYSTASGAILVAMLAFALAFGAAGFVADYVINAPFREPLNALDTVIQFALDHQGTEVDGATARRMYLGSLNSIRDLLPRPRRMFIYTFSETFDQVDVLVDFDGQMARCMTIANKPSFCKLLP